MNIVNLASNTFKKFKIISNKNILKKKQNFNIKRSLIFGLFILINIFLLVLSYWFQEKELNGEIYNQIFLQNKTNQSLFYGQINYQDFKILYISIICWQLLMIFISIWLIKKERNQVWNFFFLLIIFGIIGNNISRIKYNGKVFDYWEIKLINSWINIEDIMIFTGLIGLFGFLIQKITLNYSHFINRKKSKK